MAAASRVGRRVAARETSNPSQLQSSSAPSSAQDGGFADLANGTLGKQQEPLPLSYLQAVNKKLGYIMAREVAKNNPYAVAIMKEAMGL